MPPKHRSLWLEQDICGGGASGRNGGFVLSWWPKLASLAAIIGPAEAVRVAKSSEDAIGTIRDFCATHAIDADFRHGGWLWTATTPRLVIATNAWAAGIRELSRSIVVISSDIVATAPAAADLARIGWHPDPCITDSQTMVDYYRISRDGRVVFGKGGWSIAYGGSIGPAFDRSAACSPAWHRPALKTNNRPAATKPDYLLARCLLDHHAEQPVAVVSLADRGLMRR